MNKIETILSDFQSVSLDEIEDVKLMNRIDRKYWFHISKLDQLLQLTLPYYDVLEIKGERLMEYKTTYFDTPDNAMFIKHHNRNLGRYKIRRRKYEVSNNSFLEVKYKTNKKRTIKKRIPSEFKRETFLTSESNFIQDSSQFKAENLEPCLNNSFKRLTLIHKNRLDRCTIDISPVFWNRERKIGLGNLVVFELKRGRNLKSSPMVSLLRNQKIRQRGLSKYCTGRALLDSELKQNAFKSRMRFLYKQILNDY